MKRRELDFTLEEIFEEVPVKIPTDNGVEDFKLTTLSAHSATIYQNAKANCIRFDRDGRPVGFSNIADLAPLLVSLALKRPDGSAVSKTVIGKFPHRVLDKLFRTAQDMNDLNQETRYSESIHRLFSRNDSPVNLDEVREWLEVQDLEDADVKAVTILFKETDEDMVKNSQNSTTDGSS